MCSFCRLLLGITSEIHSVGCARCSFKVFFSFSSYKSCPLGVLQNFLLGFAPKIPLGVPSVNSSRKVFQKIWRFLLKCHLNIFQEFTLRIPPGFFFILAIPPEVPLSVIANVYRFFQEFPLGIPPKISSLNSAKKFL